jgi:predicted phage terminase large subunit-like protein
MSKAEIEKLRLDRLVPSFAALFQQEPSQEFEQLTEKDFEYGDHPSVGGGAVISLDWAYGLGPSSSYSVAQVWRRRVGGYILLDQFRARCEMNELVSACRHLINKWTCTVALIEAGPVFDFLSRGLRASPVLKEVYRMETGKQSKLQRLEAVVGLIYAGLVALPSSASWLRVFLDEVTSFPASNTDDQIDAMSQALSWFGMGLEIPSAPSLRGYAGRASYALPTGGPYIFARPKRW